MFGSSEAPSKEWPKSDHGGGGVQARSAQSGRRTRSRPVSLTFAAPVVAQGDRAATTRHDALQLSQGDEEPGATGTRHCLRQPRLRGAVSDRLDLEGRGAGGSTSAPVGPSRTGDGWRWRQRMARIELVRSTRPAWDRISTPRARFRASRCWTRAAAPTNHAKACRGHRRVWTRLSLSERSFAQAYPVQVQSTPAASSSLAAAMDAPHPGPRWTAAAAIATTVATGRRSIGNDLQSLASR